MTNDPTLITYDSVHYFEKLQYFTLIYFDSADEILKDDFLFYLHDINLIFVIWR